MIGSSYDSVPRFDTNSDGNFDVCIQCEGPCVSGHRSWQCAESEINSDTEFTGQSLGDNELHGAVEEALRALFSSVDDPEGLNTVMLLLLGWYGD